MPSSGSVSPASRGRPISAASSDSNKRPSLPVRKSVAFARDSLSGDRNWSSNNDDGQAQSGGREVEPLLSIPRSQSIDVPRKAREQSVDAGPEWEAADESKSTLYLFALALPLGG